MDKLRSIRVSESGILKRREQMLSSELLGPFSGPLSKLFGPVEPSEPSNLVLVNQ